MEQVVKEAMPEGAENVDAAASNAAQATARSGAGDLARLIAPPLGASRSARRRAAGGLVDVAAVRPLG